MVTEILMYIWRKMKGHNVCNHIVSYLRIEDLLLGYPPPNICESDLDTETVEYIENNGKISYE